MPCERQFLNIRDQDIGGARQLDVEAGVEHIRRGHALMHEARLGTDDFGEVREERDDVVLGLALDRIDACDVESGVPRLLPDREGGFLGDDAKLGHRIGGVRLDLEPDAKAGLGVPDGNHLGAGITRDHVDLDRRRSRSTRRRARRQSSAECRSYHPHHGTAPQPADRLMAIRKNTCAAKAAPELTGPFTNGRYDKSNPFGSVWGALHVQSAVGQRAFEVRHRHLVARDHGDACARRLEFMDAAGIGQAHCRGHCGVVRSVHGAA
jgi:hypothetical protein